MSENDDVAELLFFDTFSHEVDTDINLDLVQFPKPVYITQVRIIPLGARVQADFPGGVRLGATNPSKFDIEFFVNDLGMPGASTFENLGHLEYNQNDCIHLECTQEKIPTDGLVLRGWYSTITLAVYGILTNSVNEPIASPPPPPCEPAGPEDICNLNADSRASGVLQEADTAKDEWKEPLPGEVSQQLAQKTNTSDFEREDLDYGPPREHFHHSGDERERDRERDRDRDRRLRKASHSSERSASSRNRTHSESNERDYIRSSRNEREREKTSRDWSRSPDYSRHARRKRSERSRSDAEEGHKWPPRTPPVSIDSPTRPRSPDTMEYGDDEIHYKLKTRTYMRSTESLTNVTGQDSHTLDDDDTPGTPGEQFEPILSDDEIIGDDDSNADDVDVDQTVTDEFEAELLAAAAAAGPAINDFDPFKMPLGKFEIDLRFYHSKELDNLKLIFKKLELQTKCTSVEAFLDSSTTSVDERESFVLLGEQVINQLVYLSQQFKRRNFVLQEFFKSEAQNLAQTFSVVQIALDFEAACSQPQPAYKIRHIKLGARLTELLASSPEFLHYLLNDKQFDPFAALFKLYHQDYMALSIKLMLLKAVYALLDTKMGLRHFLNAKVNGYQLILNTLQQTHLTRTKYALQAIVKKLNLNEALECIQENCTKLFVFSNYHPTAPDEPYQLIEEAIEHVLNALTRNALSYQQPKRFLPVSKKYEIIADSVAQRSFSNALQSYFVQHSLAESLLLLLSNATELPSTLLLRSLDLLKALLESHVGVDYFVDDCFETTQMLIAVLLGIEEVPEEIVVSECDKQENVEATEKGSKEEEVKKEDESSETPSAAVKNSPKEDTMANVSIVEEQKKPLGSIKKTDEDTVKGKETKDDTEVISLTPLKTEETIEILSKRILNRLQKVGIELAFKVQTRYHLDAIVYTATSNDYDANKLAIHLHALYSQTCNSPGRQHTVEVIGLNHNMQVFMDLIKKEQRLQSQRQLTSPGAKYKSPVLSYAVDIVDCCVRYCENLDYLIEHGANILELAKNHETFEPSVSAVLQEMFVYLKPLEAINIFAYDDITSLVEVITRSLEYITTFPGDLIMGLRILRHLAIGPMYKSFKCADTEELKYRFVALQFYAADGVQTLTQILEKLCSYFEQPGLHTPALMTIQGVHCCQIILPTLQILREMLSFAIQCRDVEFKDLTAIDHLMKTYSLLHYFPAASQACNEIRQAKQEIIQIFLAYTQPNEQYEESLNKSLWTQMIREILKNIDGPSTFIPGLQVLAELLPLPLPMPLPVNVNLLEAQKQRLITERKLWSAHLHPQSAQIAKLVETIVPSSFSLLIALMIRVCLQLADLAPNMSLLISKTLSDSACSDWTNASCTPTLHLSRLLDFFARVTCHAALKISALSILSGKLWELFHAILSLNDPNELCCKCQEAILRILKNFLNAKISIIYPQSISTPELNLASALPTKDLIPRIVEVLLASLLSGDLSKGKTKLALENLMLLSEHDITFYHLSLALKQKRAEFKQWLQKSIESTEKEEDTQLKLSYLEKIISLLFAFVKIEQENANQNHTIPMRTLKLSPLELSNLVGFQKDASPPHFLKQLTTTLAKDKEGEKTHEILTMLLSQLEGIESTTSMDTDDESSNQIEPTLPQSEGIVMQFAARPIFTDFTSDLSNEQLTESFWFAPKSDIPDSLSSERVTCDLTELAAACLPPEINLTSDCKRVLHLSASPQSNRERTPTAPCFRTRRVEVEPSTGRPEKKIYITPVRGRGFSRAPPSRGDLFRSRPPNTSRPPSLHVDDFLALETCGAQPTGPTGYNKIPPIMRGSRVGRSRGSRISSAAAYRKSKVIRTSSPSTWGDGGSPHYRTASSDSHFGSDSHYSSSSHYSGRPRGRGSRSRGYLR